MDTSDRSVEGSYLDDTVDCDLLSPARQKLFVLNQCLKLSDTDGNILRIFEFRDSKDYPKLPLTERGDVVNLQYLASSESMLTVMGFDNTSIVVEQSADEVAVTTAAKGRQQTEVNRDNSTDLQGQFDNLSPEQKVEALKRAKP